MKIDPKKVEALEWIEQAMKLDAWKKFWSHMEKETGQMKEHAMIVGAQPSIIQANLLRLCGLEAPKTPEEAVQVFMAFRAVVNYITNKQALMVANRDIYREGLRQLQEDDQLETEPQVNLTSKT